MREAASVDPLDAAVNKINPLWIFISCGYMVSWTSIGSLISYFKARQGAAFYVALYCAFYLPGLPISLLQQRYDETVDKRFGSANAFMFRVCLSMAVKIVMLFIMPFIPGWSSEESVPYVILGCMSLVGTFSWLCHGTACQLCSMFPPSSTAFLQTGFRTPEIYTVFIVAVLRLGSSASEVHIIIFYYATAMVVALGAISWIIVARSKPAMVYFAMKDRTHACSGGRNHEAASLLSAPDPVRGALPSATSSSSSSAAAAASAAFSALGSPGAFSPHTPGGEKSPFESDSEMGGGLLSGGGGEESREYVAAQIRPCRVAIFLNIWSSIFSAAFFAYVRPAGRVDTELVLYFVRLFSDLVGRPLARLPRPSFVQNKDQIVRIAWFRMVLMVIFFAYIAFDWIPKNDLFIIAVVCVFSVLSGYLAVLSYEYAAASLETKAGQSLSGTLMNSTFQLAAFSAVIMGVIVSSSGVFVDPALTAAADDNIVIQEVRDSEGGGGGIRML